MSASVSPCKASQTQVLFTDPKCYFILQINKNKSILGWNNPACSRKPARKSLLCSTSLSPSAITVIPYKPAQPRSLLADLATFNQVQPDSRTETLGDSTKPTPLPALVKPQDRISPTAPGRSCKHHAERRFITLCFSCTRCLLQSPAILQSGIISFHQKKITVKSISVKAKLPSEKQETLHHLQGASSELHAVDASDNTETVSQNEILFIYFLAVTVTGTHFLKGL